MNVELIVDSTVDVPEHIRSRLTVVPLTIHFGQEEYLDGVTMDKHRFYERLVESDVLPTTSQASPAAFDREFRRVRCSGGSAVVLTIAAGLSGTYQSACIAAEGRERIFVVDTMSASIGSGILARYAIDNAHLHAGELAALLERRRQDVCIIGLVDTLEYLQKGGRIGKVTAMAGTMLQIKPIITFAPDGQLQSVAKVRGRHQVMRKLVDMAVDRCGEHKRYNLAVAHGGAPEEMETVRQMLTEALPNSDHLWDGEIDGTLYIGDGVLGAAVQVLD